MPVVGLIGGLGVPELALILVVVLILFGAGRLPQVFESMGKGLKSFRDAQKEPPVDVTHSAKQPAELPNHADTAAAHEVEDAKETV